MGFLIDYLAYISVKILSIIFTLIPTKLALKIGSILGILAYYVDIKHKAVAYDNISIAFPGKSIPERKEIVRGLFINFALSLVELLRLSVVTTSYFEKYIEFEGRRHIEDAVKKAKGLIFLAVHFGSWELSNIICVKLGLTYKVIAREQKRYSKLNELLNSYRQALGTVVVTRGITTREIVKSLHNNEVVGMVADQGGRDGCLVDFFGKDASMPTGAIRLALKLDAPVLLAFIVRKHGPFHQVIIKSELELVKTGDLEQDTLVNLKQVVKTAEEVISNHPEQYMWFYKIWKYSLSRSIVILSDGKAGHLRQSEAMANLLKEGLSRRGFISSVKIINVNFKNQFSRQAVTFCAFLAKKRLCKSCLWCLSNFFKGSSFEQLTSAPADFVISCGEALSAVNFIYSAERSAKSIVILKPKALGFGRFDLVVVSKHDHPPERDNIALTEGAANLISGTYLAQQAKILLNSFPQLAQSQKFRIGLLLGGDTKKYILTKELAEKALTQISQACEELDCELLISTSRRTSEEVVGFLKKEISASPRCKLLIIASENNHPAAVGGILAVSGAVIVSGESISMVSEAASSGKDVVVFRLSGRKRFNRSKDKHEMFLQHMADNGYINLVEPEQIGRALSNIILDKKQTKRLDNNLVLAEALEKII